MQGELFGGVELTFSWIYQHIRLSETGGADG
jgi:hypothetical protein